MRKELKNKYLIGFFVCLVVSLLTSSILTSFLFNGNHLVGDNSGKNIPESENQNLQTSDVAGMELYAEQISAYVASSKSIIRQSLFTNDTNIFKNLDFNDPGFYRCNMMLTASNGKSSGMFPSVLSQNVFGSQFFLSYNAMFGFLLYDDDVEPDDASDRASRAFKVIKNAFEIEVFGLETSQENLFPFIAYYPDWDIFLNRLYYNLPKDGYWGAFDIDRISSDEYLENNHLSSTFLLIDSLETLTEGLNYTSSQFNFDISQFDLSFLEMLNITNMLGDLTELIDEDMMEMLGIEDFNETMIDLLGAIGGLSSTMLEEGNRFVTMFIQYEGKPEGITQGNNPNEYVFDLFNAIGYSGSTLYPSEKIMIAIIGAMMCEIDINILSTDIHDTTPSTYQFSDDIIEDIAFIMWLMGYDYDVYSLKNYEFKNKWVRSMGVNRLYSLPYNPVNETDIINYLEMLGFPGLPFILSGMLNPISTITVNYSNSYSEPNMRITKTVENASNGHDSAFTMNITATNVGNISAWGVPFEIPIDVGQTITDLVNALVPGGMNVINAYSQANYGQDFIPFLSLDEDPRIFQFDSYGSGVSDTTYPEFNPADLTTFMPYNAQLANDLAAYSPELASFFNNSESVYNPENWYLLPGEFISYNITDVIDPVSSYDAYSSFDELNFTIKDDITPKQPNVVTGITHTGTNSSMALIQDEIDWVIDSVETFIDNHEVWINFKFENTTYIDLTNNTLDRIRIYLNATSDGFSTEDSFYFKNYTSSAAQEITPISYANDTYTFEFAGDSINGLFDPSSNNHTLRFKLIIIDNEAFNLSIDRIYLDFSLREIVPVIMDPASVSYSNQPGTVQYSSSSNSLVFSTYDMASILATSYLEKPASRPGEVNTLYFELKNVGSSNATFVNYSMSIPGIIKDKYSFQVRNSTIYQAFSVMEPGDIVKANFTFYTPNTLEIAGGTVLFQNPKRLYQNMTTLSVISNELILTAPVDYLNKTPYLRVIEINYTTSNSAPQLYDIFELSISITNLGPKGIDIPDIQILFTDDVAGLKRIDNNVLNITNIAWNTTKSVSMTLQKVTNKGYYFPPISFVLGSESSTIQINKSDPMVLGVMGLQITKNASIREVVNGNNIVISLEVVNTGTITMENITLNDMNSYFQEQFSLIDGTLVNIIEVLDPGESATFYYIVYGKGQGIYNLTAASVNYYYLSKQFAESNDIPMKIIFSPYLQMLLVIIPVIISIITLALYRYFKWYYRPVKLEKSRKDDKMETQVGKLDILTHSETLLENLNRISSTTKTGGEEKK